MNKLYHDFSLLVNLRQRLSCLDRAFGESGTCIIFISSSVKLWFAYHGRILNLSGEGNYFKSSDSI